MISLVNGDCLQELPKLPNQSFNLILTDLPYGVTQNKADICLPLDKLWVEWKRLLKPNGAVILTSQFPFTIDLVNSNREWFKYDLVWDKILVSGFLNANRMPLRCHEQILVFYDKQPTFNPQKTIGEQSHSRGTKLQVDRRNYGEHEEVDNGELHGNMKFPTSIIQIQKPHSSVALHPTEKPVELAEYLIRTYTAVGDCVLDNCCGVGWSAVACKKLFRNFWGCDVNSKYIEQAKDRVSKVFQSIDMFATNKPKQTEEQK
jgi:site-specific DNA-methyltransferase (adenine-specific)